MNNFHALDKHGTSKAIFSLFNVTTACLLLVLAYLQHKLPMDFFFNSDFAYLPTLYRSLFIEGHPLSDWFLSPAPYFVPDWPLYFLANRLWPHPFYADAAFLSAQVALTFGSIVLINRCLLSIPSDAFLVSGMIVLALSAIALVPIQPYVIMLKSVCHYGAFLAGLLSLWLLLTHPVAVPGAKLHWRTGMIFILTTAMALSDGIFVVQFALPLILTALVFRHSNLWTRPAAIQFIWPLIAGSALGSVSYKWVVTHPTRPSTKLSLKHVDTQIEALIQFAQNFYHGHGFLAALIAVWYFAMLIIAVCRSTRRLLDNPAKSKAYQLAVFVLLQLACLLLAHLVVSGLTGVAVRHFIPVYFSPFLFGPALVMAFLPATSLGTLRLFTSASSLVLTAWIAWFSLHGFNELKVEYYPEDIRCLDQAAERYGLENGIAEYWDAKRTSILSHRKLNIGAVAPSLEQYHWITALHHFSPAYDFALIRSDSIAKQPDESLITRLNGPPVETVQCTGLAAPRKGILKVLVYPKNQLKTTAPSQALNAVTGIAY